MTAPATIAEDPHWLPHALDVAGQRIHFVRIARDRLSATGFLADVTDEEIADEAWLSFADVQAMTVETGPIHFIFHSAFCRSTLLARAMNMDGVSVGMAEPQIVTQLAGAGDAAQGLVKPVCNLLSRPWPDARAVFVKPTNHANMLIPALMAARPDAKAVLMTNPLESFLRSVDRRALMGRRWGRQLYLEVMGYAGMDFGMDGREQFSMTDLQAAGLAWFLSQRLFAGLVGSNEGKRFRILDGDRFNAERSRTIEAVLDFAGLQADASAISAVMDGPIFAKHAKLGGAFADPQKIAEASPSFQQECEQVAEWIGMIAQQAGLDVPVKQTLF
ncbi:hypothetical protein [Aurantiacibacter gangjinensis]|uniref:Uncharacterized protein n=1 Tax=Aurantiacibacter gangjinensis TaxID=502682 RepID=A0A0G9MKG7_9SPHN|nr:hypothetical protein [Aurantiacibacter gangjinensis]APE29439.1 hypothetical protein BMF35_b0184 [Aurantiacibacter gangjinensis]KLE31175.1 hypothetical protein AAW01_13225 [Aurantiacibacter gangjinensis]